MARPAQSVEQRRAALIDAQDYLSEEEKRKKKEEEERKRREREAAERAEKERQNRQIAENLARKAAEKENPLQINAQHSFADIAKQEEERRKAEEKKQQAQGIAENLVQKSEEKVNPFQRNAEQNIAAIVKKEEEKRKAEEVKRLYNTDVEAEEKRLSEMRAKNLEKSGTAAVVSKGTQAGRTGKVDLGFLENKDKEKEAEDLEREILRAKEVQRQAKWIEAQDSSEKMAKGREGYAAWEEAKAKRKENGKSTFEQVIDAAWNAPDMSSPAGMFQQAVNIHREDTSENEPNDDWTYEQKRTFGYFWILGDYESAAEYAREVNNAIWSGKKKDAVDEITEMLLGNGFSKAAADVASIPASIFSGAGYLDKLAQQAAQGYYTESSLPVIEDLREAFRTARAQQINAKSGTLGKEWGILSGKGLGDLYSVGMGAADSLFAAAAGGKPGALISAFSSSASSATNDALLRGADLSTALGYGTFVGAAELLPEYLSVDSLFKLGSAKNLGKFFKNVGQQAATEGLEGTISSISGALADDIIMGELSKFNQDINAYMMDGYTREEAEQMAAEGGRADIILDALGEAIGGGMSGAAVSAYKNTIGKQSKPPVPFDGKAVPGSEAEMVAAKIEEIENRPISEAEKAAKMEEVKAAAEAFGKEQGLVEEARKFEEIHKARAAEIDRAVEVGRKLGVSVSFDENIAGNGIHTSDGRIFINPNTENPVMQVLVHELTHDIETSGLYENFSGKILDYAKNVQGVDLKQMERAVIEDYREAGQELTPELADREIVAKFAETYLFTDQKAIDRLCDTEPNLFRRIKYWIEDAIAKFRGTEQERFLVDTQRLYERALATRGERTGINGQESEGRSYEEMARENEYEAAVNSGDMETAQRFVDEAAKAAGYDSPILYHGTNSFGFTEFDLSKMKDKRSIFLTDNPKIASTYSGVEGKREIGKKEKTAENLSVEVHKGRGNYGLYADLGRSLEIDAEGQVWNHIQNWWRALRATDRNTFVKKTDKEFQLIRKEDGSTVEGGTIEINDHNKDFTEAQIQYYLVGKANNVLSILAENAHTTRDISAWAKNWGYDSVVFKGLKDNGGRNYDVDMDETANIYIIFDPNKAKSADPVTYDDDGNVIPLSERFKKENPDLRYSAGRSYDEMREETAAEEKNEKKKADVVTPSMERADKNLGAQDWKNLAEGIAPEFLKIWAMKDFSRFLDSAAGGNKVLRQQLFELYEKPLNEAQGNYARNYAEKAKSISEKFKELGIKADSKESAAVQRIGEGVKEIDKKGNTVPYTLENLKNDFPDFWENIKAGADYCRKVYDEFLHDLNAMYSEIYPATVEEANARVSGYNDRIKNDAEYINRYNEVIGKLEEQKTAKQKELSRKRPNSLIYAELQNQIANIDRRIEIANKRIERIENRKLTKEISRDTLQAQIENGEILKNKQIKPRKDYFRHFQELTDEFAEIADIFSNDQRIPPNLAGKSETTKPRTIWTSIAQSRSNNNYYTEDAVGGLLRYTEIAEKLLVFDPLISHFRDVNSAIRAAGDMADNEVKGKGTNAGQFARHMDGVTNQLAGKTNPILDRAIADWGGGLGRATMKAVEALNRRVKSNAILGNFRSALVQIGNLPNAALYIQNPVDWTMGAISLTNSTPEIIEARSKSNFMNRRYMGDTIDALTKEIQQNKLLDKPKEFALWMLGAGDKAAAELIWHTAYSQAVRNPEVLSSGKGLRGYENAVDYADDITRRSIGGRAEGDIPLAEESKIIGLVAPFQIEVANTFNAFTEQIGKKNAAGIIGFEIGVWLINTVLEGITGDRPLGLDYIDAIWDIIAEATGDDDEEEKNLWDLLTFAGGRILGEAISGMPLGAQIGDAITGGDEQKAEDWFGDSDPTRYGTGNIGMGAFADAANYFISGETPEDFYNLFADGKKNSYEEIAKPIVETVDTFAPLVMPWGGKQLARTVKGMDQLIQGGAYGESDEGKYMKFPQSYDPESIIKTVLFGQYASDRGQDYIDSGFSKKLSEKQTEQMEIAELYGISNEEFYDIVLGLKPYDKKTEKQQALFENEDLDNWEKSVIDYILFGDPVKGMDAVVPEREYSDEEAFYRSGLDESGKRLFDAGYSREVIETVEKVTTKSDRKADDIKNIQKALDCSEAEAFEILQKRNGDWAFEIPEDETARAQGAADFYGMSTEDYLSVYNYRNFGEKKEEVVENLMAAKGWDRDTAEENYNKVFLYEYLREDLSEKNVAQLDTSQSWYEVDDHGYFTARNILKTVEGEKDEFGNTVSGSKKAAAISAIAKALDVDENEAAIYYLAASGDLALSASDLSSAKQADLETAISCGWTERQFLDAVNIIKLSGATKKDDIIDALMEAGCPYEMAIGYYNLSKNYDYWKR